MAQLNTPSSATHLGIRRDILSKFGVKYVVSDRVQTARKTVYALMGARLYGLNEINPTISVHMFKCFVIPRLLYELDVIRLTKADVTQLSSYYIQLLKHNQHNRMLSVYDFSRNIVDKKESMEYKIAFRQLALNSKSSDNWFMQIVQLSDQYGLGNVHLT